MSRKIPPMSSRRFRRLLERGGARFVRQRGTSHAIYERLVGNRRFTAPVISGAKELSPGYMKMVFRQLGFADEEIEALLKD
ncbi:type II toxin-antitoxin system HicA family toxin [Candidatus Poribacteria bacterium]|nr:type II toxin-antitoxin system HicA family toxin [Candidatus Poribacteria bacterium]